MLHLCLTFDYELFLGGASYSEQEVLIEPTDKILNILKNCNIPATFFADVCCLLRYKSEGKHGFLRQAESQLKRAFLEKHDIQLHIHPHWLVADLTGEIPVYDAHYYRIHAFEEGESKLSMESIIADGKRYLEELLRTVDQKYKCVAFRAGGYCIQPEQRLIEILIKQGIRLDSSVCYGMHKNDGVIYYDYRNISANCNWYMLPQTGLEGIQAYHEAALFEVPIGSVKNVIKKVLIRQKCQKLTPYQTKGKTILSNEKKTFSKRIKNYLIQPYMFSLDEHHYTALEEMVKCFLNSSNNDSEETYIALIGHPKVLNKEILENLGLFCEAMKKYQGQISFETMSSIYTNKLKGI